MNPYDKTHELVRAIRESDAFKNARDALSRLQGDEAAKDMVNDFRRRQFEYQTKEMMGQTISDEDRQSIEKLVEVINLNPDARAYLQAEYQLSIILADVQRILGEGTSEALLPDPFGFSTGGMPQ